MDEVVVKKTKYDELQSQIKELSEVVLKNRKELDEVIAQMKKDNEDIVNKLIDLKVEVLQLNSKVKDVAFVKNNTSGVTVQEFVGDAISTEPMIIGGVPVDINGNPLKPVFDQKKFIKPQNEILLP